MVFYTCNSRIILIIPFRALDEVWLYLIIFQAVSHSWCFCICFLLSSCCNLIQQIQLPDEMDSWFHLFTASLRLWHRLLMHDCTAFCRYRFTMCNILTLFSDDRHVFVGNGVKENCRQCSSVLMRTITTYFLAIM